MRKRSLLIIISIIVISLVILGLYSTFASSASTGEENVYNITLTDSGSEVSVPAGESKTVIYKITNTNKGTVKYGLAYAGDNIEVKVYDESQDKVTGNIDYGETKFIKLIITNTGNSTSTASVKSVMGYKNGGELSGSNIVPSGHTMVTEVYTKPSGGSNPGGGNSGGGSSNNLVTHITNLYLNNKDTNPVTNNGISYGYASIYDKDSDNNTSGGLMNDRHGTMSVGIDEGNVRYYGANPNNYIYFNCDNYSNQTASTCEVWRIIGVFDGKVKLMRSESIGDLAWDYDKNQDLSLTTYNNDWSNSSLMGLLNGAYYNNYNTVYYSLYKYEREEEEIPEIPEIPEIGSGERDELAYEKSNVNKNSSVSLLSYDDYNSYSLMPLTLYNIENYLNFKTDSNGIKDSTRELISETLWYLRGWDNYTIYSNQMYDHERNNGRVSITEQPTTLLKNVGLPYVSDYGYASDLESCTENFYYYDNSTCTSTNWMNSILGMSSGGWLMAPYSSGNSGSSDGAWFVNSPGYVYIASAYSANGVAPVLHLDSELSIGSGDGSEGSPYKLAVN